MASPLFIKEFNEAGSLVSEFIASESPEGERIDKIHQEVTQSVWSQCMSIFLPAGFPNSVTDDYVEYQIYDSLQAFASTIASLLSSRAVLEGVGVGDPTATPTAALLLTILQESTGRIATIIFAYRLGTALEPECKTYRLAADIFNDAAMILDCLSPVFPRAFRVAILSLSSVLRALCGVAAGSSKSSLSAHFARRGNLGELNAKDASQETVLSLLGMLCGSLVVSRIRGLLATWATLLTLLSLHLYLNYAAVKAVCMRTLNRQRANIVFSHLRDTGKVLDPREVSRRERIFERNGVLRWRQSRSIGAGVIGVDTQKIFQVFASQQGGSGSWTNVLIRLSDWRNAFQDCGYLMWFDIRTHTVLILLKRGSSARDHLEAWTHGLLTAKQVHELSTDNHLADAVGRLRATRREIKDLFESHVDALEAAGWDLRTSSLETASGKRIEITQG